MIVLYDLAGAAGRRFSPNCWRTRLALAHKGLACETRPTRFTEIAAIGDGRHKTLPVIDDGGRLIGDSAEIADYLETMYPERPSLFGGVSGRALTHFVQTWSIATLHTGIIELILLDIWKALDPIDRDYFRASRERRFGKALEEVQAGREERLPLFRQKLQPLRALLGSQPWLGGDSALYADYLAFAPFQWARSVSDVQLLAPDDPIADWVERCLDLHDGLARSAGPTGAA
jgi:glutathione S-transferase